MKKRDDTMKNYREMRRAKQALSPEECRAVLKSAKRGVLSMIGDGGCPYGIYMNPHYNESDGKIYFHGSRIGHKAESLGKDPRASFTAIDEGVKDDGGWAYTFRSVVVFGHVESVDDQEKAIRICRAFARQFNPDDADIEDEIRRAGAVVHVFALVPEHITGKRVHEA